MSVAFHNFEYSYLRNGVPVFAPSDEGQKLGPEIKDRVEATIAFDPFFYHLRSGHVVALHMHRDRKFHSRMDLKKFFYGIARNRVGRNLHEIGIREARHYARWSCVKNPYGEPAYALPYGFVQSPILATLALMLSPVGTFLRKIQGEVCVSVYMDDISLSSDDFGMLQVSFAELGAVLNEASFVISEDKLREPALAIDLFNCDLAYGQTRVLQTRRNKFFSTPREQASIEAFELYCQRIEDGNASD